MTLPLAFLTLGIAWFFVSLLMLVITDDIVSGFSIHGFWTYVGDPDDLGRQRGLDYTPGPWQITGKRRQRYELRRGR